MHRKTVSLARHAWRVHAEFSGRWFGSSSRVMQHEVAKGLEMVSASGRSPGSDLCRPLSFSLGQALSTGGRKAEALKITANDLHELNLVDEVVPEPLGGAHNDHNAMADTLRDALLRNLNELEQIDPEIRLQERYAKYRRHGKYIEG